MKNASDEIIVKFDQVTKQYGDLVVLDKLNLDIKKMKWFQLLDLQDQVKLQFSEF